MRFRWSWLIATGGLGAAVLGAAVPAAAQQGVSGPEVTGVDGPNPVPEVQLAPTLDTVPVRRSPAAPNQAIIDASPLPRDKAPQLDYAAADGELRDRQAGHWRDQRGHRPHPQPTTTRGPWGR